MRRTKAPYSVEIDLGEVPRKQTVRAVGYDSNGKLIDEDAWSINQGSRAPGGQDPARRRIRPRAT